MLSGLMKYVDNLLGTVPPAEFSVHRRQAPAVEGSVVQGQLNDRAAVNNFRRNREPPTKTANLEEIVMRDMLNAGLEDH